MIRCERQAVRGKRSMSRGSSESTSQLFVGIPSSRVARLRSRRAVRGQETQDAPLLWSSSRFTAAQDVARSRRRATLHSCRCSCCCSDVQAQEAPASSPVRVAQPRPVRRRCFRPVNARANAAERIRRRCRRFDKVRTPRAGRSMSSNVRATFRGALMMKPSAPTAKRSRNCSPSAA